MNSYTETSGHRLYRDADRAVLGGVCAGLAGYFGLNLKVTRLLAVIAFLAAMPFAVFGYIAAVFLIPAESRGEHHGGVETSRCWGIRKSRREARTRDDARRKARDDYRAPPAGPTIDAVRERCRSLDKRLAELEKQVTSPRFQLEQEFRKL
ncbi:MAG: PspC domain-containing protein [Woeseiaceae bacterium]